MGNKSSENKRIYIPTNIRTKTYFFEGFGFSELVSTLVLTIIVGIFDLVYFSVSKNEVAAVVIILVAVAVGVTLFTKDRTNMSVTDYVRDLIIFSKSQKKYLYNSNAEEDINDIIQENKEE